MKLIKKFSTYLLENYPLLWHTRAIQLTIISILLWFFSYLIGFASWSTLQLKNYDIDRHYEKSGFLFFHIAIVTISVAIWALQFYKNNAFKSFYPIAKGYFQKMFLLLFVPFFLLLSLYYPFTKGINTKTRLLLSKEELLKDKAVFQKAEAFLLTGDHYNLGNKIYPQPFPLRLAKYDEVTQKWSPEYLEVKLAKEDSITDYTFPDSNSLFLDGKKIQFYSEKTHYSNDSCYSESAVYKFYILDINQLQWNSIWNYGHFYLIQDYYPLQEKNTVLSPDKNLAKQVQEIAAKQDWTTINRLINDAEKVLAKYEINHHLDNKMIISYLKTKQFLNLRKIVGEYRFTEKSLKYELTRRNMSNSNYAALPFTEKQEFLPLMHINESQLNQVYANYNSTYSNVLNMDALFFLLYFTLALVTLSVYFQIVKPIPFLLSLPVWGVLFILLGVFMIFVIDRIQFGHYSPNRTIFPFLFLFVAILVTHLALIKFGKKGKIFSNITIGMAILASGFVLPLLLLMVHYASRKKVMDECYNEHTVYIFDGALESVPIVFLSAFIGLFISLSLARKWLSKAE